MAEAAIGVMSGSTNTVFAGMNGTVQAMGDQCGDQNGCVARGRDRLDGSIKVEEAVVTSGGMPRRAMRNITLLAMCQALTQSSNTLMFA